MANKKRRKKQQMRAAVGRKKELKRFEMATYVAGNPELTNLEANEVAFVIRTSGGTPLNTTDVGKLSKSLQREIRALGHKLKRDGQELDPKPKEKKDESKAPAEGGIAASNAVIGTLYLVDGAVLRCFGKRPRGRGIQVGFLPPEMDVHKPETAVATQWLKGSVIVKLAETPVEHDVGPEPEEPDAAQTKAPPDEVHNDPDDPINGRVDQPYATAEES